MLGYLCPKWLHKDVFDLQRRNRSRRPRRRMSYNAKTLLCLVLCFPVGFTRMLSPACSWHRAVKCVFTMLLAAALVCVVWVAPSPYSAKRGGIELYGDNMSVEIYGPQIPETIVGANTTTIPDSGVLSAEESEQEDTTLYVYATKGAANYHLFTCQYAYASAQCLTVYEAYYLGYTPCKICNPPTYTGLQ